MPALVTHYLCGNATLKLLATDKYGNLISQHRNVFNLGTQGPDIFFYYGALPWSKGKGISKLGERMHEENTGAFILESLKYIRGADSPAKGILTAYIYGFICHYILDCHTHPYIFYKAGFIRKGGAYTAKYTCYHRMFETALDVLMLKHELDKRPSQFKAHVHIAVSEQAASEISEMYSKVLSTIYDFNISNDLVRSAITDIAHISALLRDRTGAKKLLLRSAEKAFGKLPMYSSMILPLEIKDGLDYLNTSHSVWYLPWDNSEASTSSFTENFEAASAGSKKLIEMTELFFKGEMNLESIAPAIGNRSYSTGRDCRVNLEFKYFDSIYE